MNEKVSSLLKVNDSVGEITIDLDKSKMIIEELLNDVQEWKNYKHIYTNGYEWNLLFQFLDIAFDYTYQAREKIENICKELNDYKNIDFEKKTHDDLVETHVA